MGTSSGSEHPLDPYGGDGERRVRSLEDLRRLLADKDQFESLVALTEGDPLGLEDATFARLRKRHMLLNPRQVMGRALTWLATWGVQPIGVESLADLIDRSLAVAIEELLEEEARAAREDSVSYEPLEPRYALIARRLGLTPSQVRYASQAMNDLPEEQREAISMMLVRGQGFTRFAREKGIGAREARDRILRALAALRKRIDELEKEGGHDA